MSRTLLQIVNDVQAELGLQQTSTIVSNSDKNAKQLLAIAHRIGDELVSRVDWPQLERQATITIVGDQANYALPGDYDKQIYRTHWDRSQTWELQGPLSPQEWNWRQEGISAVSPQRRFRIKGIASKQFYIDPTPTSAEAGEVLVYEYISKSWVKPPLWAASTSYTAGDFVLNSDGELLIAGSTASSGASEPDSGNSYSDGTITWSVSTDAYDRFTQDTDSTHFDTEMFSMGIMARFMYQKGLQYQLYEQKFEELINRETTAFRGAKTLDMVGARGPIFIGPASIPDTGLGS